MNLECVAGSATTFISVTIVPCSVQDDITESGLWFNVQKQSPPDSGSVSSAKKTHLTIS